MKTVNDALAFGLERSGKMLTRFCEDLTPAEYLHRPCPKANCAAWIVGHLVLSDRRALAAMGGEGPVLPEGFEHRFSREPGSAEAAEFGDVTILLQLFIDHRARLVAKVKSASAELLATPMEKPHPMFADRAELVGFFAVHTAMHAGQISSIRRSLGRPPVV